MTVLYLDCGMGAAGDMLTAALLELFEDKEAVCQELNALQIPNVRFAMEQSSKCGIVGTHMRVFVSGEEEGDHSHHHHRPHCQGYNQALQAGSTQDRKYPGHIFMPYPGSHPLWSTAADGCRTGRNLDHHHHQSPVLPFRNGNLCAIGHSAATSAQILVKSRWRTSLAINTLSTTTSESSDYRYHIKRDATWKVMNAATQARTIVYTAVIKAHFQPPLSFFMATNVAMQGK